MWGHAAGEGKRVGVSAAQLQHTPLWGPSLSSRRQGSLPGPSLRHNVSKPSPWRLIPCRLSHPMPSAPAVAAASGLDFALAPMPEPRQSEGRAGQAAR